MNNFKICIPCVCTGSGCKCRKQVYERHDIIFRNFSEIVLFVICWNFELSGEMGQYAHHSLNCTVRVSQVFFNVLAFLPFFVARSLKKVKFRKWLVLDLYSCCVGQFGSIGKSYHFGFLFGKVKNSPVLVT